MRWSGQRTCVPKSKTTKRNGWAFSSERKFLFALWSRRVVLRVWFQERLKDKKIGQRTWNAWESLGSYTNRPTINCRCFESYKPVCDILCPELVIVLRVSTLLYDEAFSCPKKQCSIWFLPSVCDLFGSGLITCRHSGYCSTLKLSVVHGLIIPIPSFSVKRLKNKSFWCVRSF